MSRQNHHHPEQEMQDQSKSPSESGPDQRSTSESSQNVTKEEESNDNAAFIAEIALNENSKPFDQNQTFQSLANSSNGFETPPVAARVQANSFSTPTGGSGNYQIKKAPVFKPPPAPLNNNAKNTRVGGLGGMSPAQLKVLQQPLNSQLGSDADLLMKASALLASMQASQQCHNLGQSNGADNLNMSGIFGQRPINQPTAVSVGMGGGAAPMGLMRPPMAPTSTRKPFGSNTRLMNLGDQYNTNPGGAATTAGYMEEQSQSLAAAMSANYGYVQTTSRNPHLGNQGGGGAGGSGIPQPRLQTNSNQLFYGGASPEHHRSNDYHTAHYQQQSVSNQHQQQFYQQTGYQNVHQQSIQQSRPLLFPAGSMTPQLKPQPPSKQFSDESNNMGDPLNFLPQPQQQQQQAQAAKSLKQAVVVGGGPGFNHHSLTPNPKCDSQKKLEVNFKGLQNYVLSNMDSSDQEQESDQSLDSLEDQENTLSEDAMGCGLIGSKPWEVPSAPSAFHQNPIFLSPKPALSSHQKVSPLIKPQNLQNSNLEGNQHARVLFPSSNNIDNSNFNKPSFNQTSYTPNPKKAQPQFISLQRTDLNLDSPTSKFKYKCFLKDLKDLENMPFMDQLKQSLKQLPQLPHKIHWRVLLDLADLAKRDSQMTYATRLFRTATQMQPYAYQGWLEWAKLCEESGDANQAKQILKEGLSYGSDNENLLVKCIKVMERDQEYSEIRKLIKSDHWRIQIEAALFEGRIGEKAQARNKFQEAIKSVGNGPVYLEASRYEEREGNLIEAIDLCSSGLDYNQKYAPLWFQWLRLYEKADSHTRKSKFDDFQTLINDMHQNVSRELEWKIHIEAAQTMDRMQESSESTIQYLSNAILAAPDNIKWKLWLIASRIQFQHSSYSEQQAREAIERCCLDVPQKQVPTALMEYSKHFEILGQTQRAREIMEHAKRISKGEWKTHFEAVMFEIRSGCFKEAEQHVKDSLDIYFATGRLWATLIQLQHARSVKTSDFKHTQETFQQALHEIPKSGEVWCEGARLAMNRHPNNPFYDLKQAERYLDFAIQFTPQYGDSFLELLRLYLIQNEEQKLKDLRQQCIHAEPNYGVLWFYFKSSLIENAIEVWERAKTAFIQEEDDLALDKSATAAHQGRTDAWMGSRELIALLRDGLKSATFDQQSRIVYGFEQVLPQVAFI